LGSGQTSVGSRVASGNDQNGIWRRPLQQTVGRVDAVGQNEITIAHMAAQ
jgi:hypothetical protein